ncbi:MAG: hypothetical protein AAF351_00130 [Pseudomonadota bacterium]
MIVSRVTLAVSLLFGVGPILAAEILDVKVTQDGDQYHLMSQVVFDVDREALFATFVDFDLHHRFSSFMVESSNLAADEQGRPGYYMLNRGCVLFFCRSFQRYGFVETEDVASIKATAHPEQSDFHISVESWDLAAQGDSTLVTYRWTVDPKFWIPPLIGPYAMRKKLENSSIDALNRIEAIARGETP